MFRRFKNVYDKQSHSYFNNIAEAISYIKGEDIENLEIIEHLRGLTKGSDEFTKLKETLPAILWNFHTTGCRKMHCATDSTGYIYYDLDLIDDYDFNKDYFCAHWRSISGTGYGALVRVKGVTTANFVVAHSEIAKSLAIPFDSSTQNIVKLNILSYDPHIHYNANSEVFDFNYLNNAVNVEEEIGEKHHTIDKNSFNYSGQWNDTFKENLRYHNLEEAMANRKLEYDENGVCDLKEDKIHYTSVYVPRKIKPGHRYYTLSAIAIKILALNPKSGLERVKALIHSINNSVCEPPHAPDKINALCAEIFAKRSSFKLFPNKTKRFFFEDPDLPLSRKRGLVLSYCNKDRGLKKKADTVQAFARLLEEGKKFNLKVLATNAGVSPNTVKKYLPEIISEYDDSELGFMRDYIKKKVEQWKDL